MSDSKTQEERLDYLVEEFKADSDEYKDLNIPDALNFLRMIMKPFANQVMEHYCQIYETA